MMEGCQIKIVSKCTYLTIVMSFLLFKHAWTQEPKSWTFNIPGVSFVSFSPIYTSLQNQHVSLSFRTRNPNGLMFCHYLKDLDLTELERINYKLCGELQQGVFVLNYRLMQFQEDGLTVGKALHDNQWHDLDVLLNSTSGELTVTLDKARRVATLNSYTRQNITTLLDWSKHSSAIYFGGTDPDTLFSDLHPHFMGCMSDIKFENQHGNLVPIAVSMLEGVMEGCVDRCSDNPCHHGGSCINAYSNSICDCFGTDYQGQYCADLGPTTVTLRGYEWLTYFMYMDDENILTDHTRFSLEFKTSRGSGVLFYAVGGTPYHSHLTASVHNGTIKVSFGFGDEDIEVTAGFDLDNYRWHNLTIIHDNQTVFVYLDGEKNHRHILGNVHHLGLDPRVFVGGGKNFVITRGLQVTQNFVGCVKNIYINEVSLLYEMANRNPALVYHGGGSSFPHYICEEVVNIPLSFPTARARIMLDTTVEMEKYFQIEFDFKTVRKDAILLYVSLEDVDTSFEYNYGYFEVWMKAGQPYLEFVPATMYPDRSQNLTIPITVNNNLWNTMHLSFNSSDAKLKVNGISIGTEPIKQSMKINNKIVLGYGFNTNSYKDSDGFVGCIRNLKIQGKMLDAMDLMETEAVSDIIIDGCNITNYCHDNTMCEHGGKCLSEWRGIACDCSQTFYTGSACHFPKYKRTCDEYYQAGTNESQVMLIDLDGSGPDDPVFVQCEMGHEVDFELFGRTVIAHNFRPNTTVRGTMMRDMKKLIQYRELDKFQLTQLTSQSGWCEQYIRYDCKHSPIGLGNITWFKTASGEMVEYLGTNKPGFCACTMTDSCAGKRCNCDSQNQTLQYDAGYNRDTNHLPLTEVTIRQESNQLDPGSANLTIGPLVCWGNNLQMPNTAVTFSNSSGYLMNHPWKSGEMKVSFRTHYSQAIILYQTGTAENINIFLVAVTSEYRVKFYFRWGMKRLDMDIESPMPISNGQWHSISIETDQFNVRCMVDMTEKIMNIPQDVPNIKLFSGVLYIGGIPDIVNKDPVVQDIDGVVGCMRGLYYNGQFYSLTRLIDSMTFGVSTECMASCWPNPCQNGAKCIEQWESHQCICANQWAHSGHNCEIDINTNSVTFLGKPESFLYFKKDYDLQLLDTSIIFSFRTKQRNTLLLYMFDHLNNFIQVELKDRQKVVTKFNRYDIITNETKEMTGYLNDGDWHQVIIDNLDGYIKVIVDVDDDLTRNSFKKKNRQIYSTRPFSTGETVTPSRPVQPPGPGIHVYVGGVPADMSSLSNLYGCVRGLKMGNHIFGLQEEAIVKSDVSPLCEDGCADKPCMHDGLCDEQWQDRQFQCDCRLSEYAGPTCNTESAGLFKGDSILQYKYKPPRGAEETVTERLELIFRVNPDATERMIIAFIYSERKTSMPSSKYVTHDYLILYLDPKQGVYLNTNHGYAIHGFGKYGNFADGRPHQLIYERKKTDLLLTVRSEDHPLYRNKSISIDDEGIARETVPSNSLDELDTIMIGGILEHQFNTIRDTANYRRYSNFTGCLSELIFKPNSDIAFSVRPLKDVRDSQNTTGTASVYGAPLDPCTTREGVITTTTIRPVPTYKPRNKEHLTFPPWNPEPAETVFIGEPPVIPTPPPTTKQTTATTSAALETAVLSETKEPEQHANKIAFIALALVAFLVLLAILIAVILVRIRRREKEEEEKKKKQDIEMKKPLNDLDHGPILENQQNQNYLARLDEFSMVSLTLGARPIKTDGTTTFKPQPSDSSHAYSSVPQSDDDAPTIAEKRFYNRKKNRPASSISEVLEEMERQRNGKDTDPEDLETLGNGPLQLHPLENNPLSCHKEDFRTMIPIYEDHIYNSVSADKNPDEIRFSEIPEEKVPSDSLPSTENQDDDVGNEADNESDTPSPPPPPHLSHEYNGDSGYEAESKPEEDEEDTALIDGFHGNNSYNHESKPSSTPDSQTYNAYSSGTSPPSPGPKTCSYLLDSVSPFIQSEHDVPEELPLDTKLYTSILTPSSPVIESPPAIIEHTSNLLQNGGDHT